MIVHSLESHFCGLIVGFYVCLKSGEAIAGVVYSDKLAHIQVGINCQYSVVQMCIREDTLPNILGAPYIDDLMSYNSLTTLVLHHSYHSQFWNEGTATKISVKDTAFSCGYRLHLCTSTKFRHLLGIEDSP